MRVDAFAISWYTHTMQAKGIIHEIEERWLGFALTFIGVFTMLFVILLITDFVPNAFSVYPPEPERSAKVASPSLASAGEMPTRIGIKAISLEVSIENPATTSIAVLDDALLRGAVRYPTSARLGQEGTVVLFGHSSYLPVVHNLAFKAFDGIQDLRVGDEIRVSSEAGAYRFAVTGVRKANAEDADTATIDLPQQGQHLMLITCDSFGTKSDRFVVSADRVGE